MQRTDPDVVSIVYSGDTDATKDEIISKVKVRYLHFWSCGVILLTERLCYPKGAIRHIPGSSIGPSRVSAVTLFGRRFYVASVYPTRSKHWIYVSCLGSNVEADTGLVHWSDLR